MSCEQRRQEPTRARPQGSTIQFCFLELGGGGLYMSWAWHDAMDTGTETPVGYIPTFQEPNPGKYTQPNMLLVPRRGFHGGTWISGDRHIRNCPQRGQERPKILKELVLLNGSLRSSLRRSIRLAKRSVLKRFEHCWGWWKTQWGRNSRLHGSSSGIVIVGLSQAFDGVKRLCLLGLVGGRFFVFVLDIAFFFVAFCSCGCVGVGSGSLCHGVALVVILVILSCNPLRGHWAFFFINIIGVLLLGSLKQSFKWMFLPWLYFSIKSNAKENFLYFF